MSDPIVSVVETDLALLNADPIGFVLAETRAVTEAEPLVLPPGKFAVVRIDFVDEKDLESVLS